MPDLALLGGLGGAKHSAEAKGQSPRKLIVFIFEIAVFKVSMRAERGKLYGGPENCYNFHGNLSFGFKLQ